MSVSKTIIYVDDDADDRSLFGEAIQKAAPAVNVIFAPNGLDAINILEGAIKSALPCLIVLDLNMPFLDGRQTFQRIKDDSRFGNIPIAILSSGESPADKSFFSNKGIPYFTKPFKISDMESIALDLSDLCS